MELWLEIEEEAKGNTREGEFVGWKWVALKQRERLSSTVFLPLAFFERWTIVDRVFGGEESAGRWKPQAKGAGLNEEGKSSPGRKGVDAEETGR